jgi:hypothetical protein
MEIGRWSLQLWKSLDKLLPLPFLLNYFWFVLFNFQLNLLRQLEGLDHKPIERNVRPTQRHPPGHSVIYVKQIKAKLWRFNAINLYKVILFFNYMYLTAGWSSGLRSRIRNQRFRVQIPVESGGYVMNKITLTHKSWLFIFIIIYVRFMYLYPLFSTRVLRDT